MTTDSAVDARAHARAMIGHALISDKGAGGIGAAFDVLETRLRQPYARALTEDDRDDIRTYVNTRVDQLFDMLTRTVGNDSVWSQDNDGEEPPA
jgi:hypothetical protein